ncbi:MAG: hypothetical protein WAN23_01775 [Candidatus Acidiferrales bacterium]
MTNAQRHVTTVCLFCLASISCPTAHAAAVKIRTVFADQEAVPNVLVIVRSIEGRSEEFARGLSGPDGSIASLELRPGLYEAIATCPYGHIPTTVHDFLVANEAALIEVTLSPDNDQRINYNEINWNVQILEQDGHPAVNAVVIGRNGEASTGVSVARTDERGRATVSVPVDGALIEIIYGERTWIEPAYALTEDVGNCRQRCLLQAKARLEKPRQLLTIRVPQ